MSHQSGDGGTRSPSGSSPQNTVFRRPCFQIAVHPSGDGAQLGVHVVASPAQRR